MVRFAIFNIIFGNDALRVRVFLADVVGVNSGFVKLLGKSYDIRLHTLETCKYG
jgi:hypothetical protein